MFRNTPCIDYLPTLVYFQDVSGVHGGQLLVPNRSCLEQNTWKQPFDGSCWLTKFNHSVGTGESKRPNIYIYISSCVFVAQPSALETSRNWQDSQNDQSLEAAPNILTNTLQKCANKHNDLLCQG